MIKLLYIAPFSKNEHNTSSGYSHASDGMLSIFSKMEEEGFLELTLMNTQENQNIKDFDSIYDFCFVTINIGILSNNEGLLNFYKDISNKCNKFYISVVWETDKIPEFWNDLLNVDWIDGFLCPSYFCANLLNHISKPKFYYPHYLNSDIFTPIDLDRKEKEDKFTVLCLGQNTERKSFRESIIAFSQALGKYDDCRLIIKSNRLGKMEESTKDMIARYSYLNNCNHAQIYNIEDENIFQEDMVSLYHNASVVLLPSKGEGFGLNLSESMMCGIPCIYTNWSAWDNKIYDIESNNKIEYILDVNTSMSNYSYDNESLWAIPNIKSIKENLKNCYDLWSKDKKEYYSLSLKGRDIIIDSFGYNAIKRYIIDIFENRDI